MAIPQLVQVGEMNGRQYFMPYRPNVKIAYYSEVKFAAYGLHPSQTWEELLAVAKRFHEAEGIGRIMLQGTLESSTRHSAVPQIYLSNYGMSVESPLKRR